MPALLLTILLIPIFWVLIIRPQQRRQREHLEMVESLRPGDRVEGFSGIQGTLTEVHDRTVRIEVAEGVVLTMARLAVASLVDEETTEDDMSEDETTEVADMAGETDDQGPTEATS